MRKLIRGSDLKGYD